MTELIKRFNKNDAGRDFAVGDIHGCFSDLQKALDSAGFDQSKDRLFSVGDLVDRGPECESALEWLAKPWFHPVRGNHDDYVCRFDTCDKENWIYNGGSWFIGLPTAMQQEFAVQFRELPLAIEVETRIGRVGIIHADVPCQDWDLLHLAFSTRDGRNKAMWSRGRIESENDEAVRGVAAVVVGHTSLKRPTVLGNVYHIDTAGWLKSKGGYFTLIDLDTLQTIPPTPNRLEW